MRGRLLLVLLGLALWVPTSSGQLLDPDIAVAPGGDITVRFDGSDVAEWIVRNDGDVAADVSLALDDAGWETDFAGKYGTLSIPAGGQTTVTTRVQQGSAERIDGKAYALTLTATTNPDAAGRSDEAQASVQAFYVAAPSPPPPPPLPPDTTARDFTIGITAVAGPLLLAYFGLGFLYQVRVPRHPVPVRGVRGSWVHVRVRNLAPWPQTVLVGLRRPDDVWQVAGDADRVTVKGRSEEIFTVYVRRLKAGPAPSRCRIGVRARRSTIYPWRRAGSILAEYEPVDLDTWSSQAIGEALREAGMNGAAPSGFGGGATLAADLRPPAPARGASPRPRRRRRG